MIDFEIYTWNKQNALAPVIFLEEVKASYHLIPTNPESKQIAKEIQKISPLGEIPVLVDQRAKKKHLTIFGVNAILLHLSFETEKLLPKTPQLRADALSWLSWQERVLYGNILLYENSNEEKIKSKCRANLKKCFKQLDRILKKRNYIVKDFSIVDIALFFLVCRPEDYGIWINELPHVRDWITRLRDLHSFQKTLTIHFY